MKFVYLLFWKVLSIDSHPCCRYRWKIPLYMYIVPTYIIMSRVRKNILVTIKIVMSKRIPLWITSKILNFSLQRAYIVLYFQYTSNVGHKVLGI